MDDNFSVTFTGDVAFSKFFKGYENREFLSKEISEFFRASNEVVTNIEAPITNEKIDSDRSLNHVNSVDIRLFLKKINSRIWNIGNNHIMDCGDKGLEDTLRTAALCNSVAIGARLKNVEGSFYTIIGDKVKVGLVSITFPWQWLKTKDGVNVTLGWDNEDEIKKVIVELKEVVDWVVIIVHGGDEFSDIPLPFVRKHYLKLLLLGADIVVGHHPHVIQNFERVENKVIFYSLGNFVFDTEYQRKQHHTDVGILLKIYFSKNEFIWNTIACKTDRNRQRIEVTDTPPVFCDLQEKDYLRLSPYIASQYITSDRISKSIRLKKFSEYNAVKWLIYDIKSCRHRKGRFLLKGRIYAYFAKKTRKANNEIVKYLLE